MAKEITETTYLYTNELIKGVVGDQKIKTIADFKVFHRNVWHIKKLEKHLNNCQSDAGFMGHQRATSKSCLRRYQSTSLGRDVLETV